jgi:unsaturated rhamnogalacturonyl hydrolase
LRILKSNPGLLLLFVACALFVGSRVSAETLVNFTDLAMFANEWLHNDCSSANGFCDGFDYDISGTVDTKDFALFKQTWLTPKQHVLSDDVADLIMRLDPDKRWLYDRAFMVQSLYEKWRVCHNPVYLKWVRDWLDPIIISDGTIIGYNDLDYNLDMIQPGKLCLAMYQQFGDQKYKLAAYKLTVQLAYQPTTFDGGFWHKQRYPYQMWLDGVFMSAPFAAQYAQMFDAPQWFDTAGFQISLIASHTQDTLVYPGDPNRRGLLYHGWDSSAFETPPQTPRTWADPVKGHSPEFWGRAVGWYAMAVVDCLDYLPTDDPRRPQMISIFNQLAAALAYYHDPNTHLWWQIVDKGYPRETYPENYTESSCSAMFSYALAKAVEKGYITSAPESYLAVSRAAFEGLVANKVRYDGNGSLRLIDTVLVGSLSGDGDYDYYMSVPRVDNDYKGVGALMRAALQYEKITPTE